MLLREKLLSGNLRKHSEQLNKFVAGFFDTDGCVGITLDKGWIKIYSKITQAASKDPDLEVMRSLQRHYGLGYISFVIPSMENAASYCDWNMNINDSKKLFNIIGKHLLVKYHYFAECIWLYDELRGLRLTQNQYSEIKEHLDCIKKLDKLQRIPKHLPWSYVAGLISGDGHLRCKHMKDNKNDLTVEFYSTCLPLVSLFIKSFKGTFREKDPGFYKWRRSLGKGDKQFSISFLCKLRKYVLLITKRNVVDRMLKFHRLPAETKYGEES